MKNYHADTHDALVAETAKVFWFLDLELDSQTYRYTDADIKLYYDRDVDDYPEIISNGEFLTYTGSAPNIDFTNWEEREVTGAADFEYDNGAKITVDTPPTNPWEHGFRQTITVNAAHDYVCHYSITGAAGNSQDINIDFFEVISPYTVYKRETITSDGERKSGEFKIDATGDTSLFVRIYFKAVPAADDTFTLHEISVKRAQTVVYQPNGFEVDEISFTADMAVDRISIDIQNVDLVMSGIFLNETVVNRSVNLAFGCLNSSNKIIALESVFDGFLTAWGGMSVKRCPISIANYFLFWHKQSLRLAQAKCPWAFASTNNTECGYSGAATECNKTWTRCKALGNQLNFGGHRWLPGMRDKKIYWGRWPGQR